MPIMQVSATLGGFYCQDPGGYPAARGKANGYRCPIGINPGVAHVVMIRSDLLQLDPTQPQTLVLTGGGTVTIPGLYLIRATQITEHAGETGTPGDPNAAMLVELVDVRFMGRFSSVNRQYNVRMAAAPGAGQPYYTESLNSGSPWTWSGMIGDLWSKLPTAFGSVPSMPYAPSGNPEGFRFLGVSTWFEALAQIFDRLELVVSYDPIAQAFFLQQQGAGQPDAQQAEAMFTTVEADEATIVSAVTQVPTTIRVFFPIVYQNYGSEPTTGQSGNTTMTPAYSQDVSSGVAGAFSGVVALWDDMSAISAFDGTITNPSALNTRATERAANWVADQQSKGTVRRYTGALPAFRPGSQNKIVTYRNFGPDVGGCCTEVSKWPPGPVVPYGSGAGAIAVDAPGAERLLPPDIGRTTAPIFPPLLQVVQIGGSGSPGDPQSPDGTNLIAGNVVRVNPTASTVSGACYTAAEACWVLVTNPVGSAAPLPKGNYYLGRLAGVAAGSGGSSLPLYVIDSASSPVNQIYRFRITSSLTIGTSYPTTGSASAVLQTWDSGSSQYIDGAAITVVDWYAFLGGPGEFQGLGDFQIPFVTGYYGYAVKLPDKAEYQILYMEVQAEYVEATTTGAISGGGAAATFGAFWSGRNTGGQTNIYDTLNYFNGKPSGTKFIGRWDSKRLKYVIVLGPPSTGSDPIPFYITYAGGLTRGGSATGNTQKWDAGTSTYIDDQIGVTFFDPQNLGPGQAAIGEQPATQGWCFLSQTSGRYEITSINYYARRMEFIVTQPFAKTETIVTVQATLLYDGVPQFMVPLSVQVRNSRQIFQGAVGNRGAAVYKPELGIWEIDWVECPGGTVSPGNTPTLNQESSAPDTGGDTAPSGVSGTGGDSGNAPLAGSF